MSRLIESFAANFAPETGRSEAKSALVRAIAEHRPARNVAQQNEERTIRLPMEGMSIV
jgi:hypothetical protein